MTQRMPTPCDSCLHRRSDTTCAAFPQAIPEDVVVWGDNHAVVREGQKNAIVWTFKPGTEDQFQDWKDYQEAEIK